MIFKRRMLRAFLYVTITVVILLTSVSIYFLTQRNKTVVLPKPTGSFAVGRTNYDWIDASRNESFTETDGNKRKLSVWVWYPSDFKENTKKAEYLPGKWETEQEKNTGMAYLQQNFKKVQTNSYQDVPLSTKQTNYPLIVFEPGMGKIVFNYTILAENLASEGYIVVAINPTYSSDFVVFSDGGTANKTSKGSMPEGDATDKELNDVGSNLIKTWSADMSFVISKLGEMSIEQGNMWTGHVDMEHIGAFGHSFGGAASVEASITDERIKTNIDIDGYLYGVQTRPEKPSMFIMSQHEQKGIDLQENNKIQNFYNSLNKDGYIIEISKTAHFSFTDNTLFFSPILKALGIYGTINGERGLQITNSYITAFFDKYLKNMDSNLLEQKQSFYPEVKLQLK
ncbi:hypothetical protein [Clostridium sp.]|uniref:alpha/beta hydrolase family protein n=1 Tax=Clostridium sp. TaxID=1506 RepID=UPI00260E3A6F|nr:hypothetical protein [Clostridium sp.]